MDTVQRSYAETHRKLLTPDDLINILVVALTKYTSIAHQQWAKNFVWGYDCETQTGDGWNDYNGEKFEDFRTLITDGNFDINYQDENGQTALYLTIHYNLYELSKQLLAANANPNLVPFENSSLLETARDLRLLKTLIEKGARMMVNTPIHHLYNPIASLFHRFNHCPLWGWKYSRYEAEDTLELFLTQEFNPFEIAKNKEMFIIGIFDQYAFGLYNSNIFAFKDEDIPALQRMWDTFFQHVVEYVFSKPEKRVKKLKLFIENRRTQLEKYYDPGLVIIDEKIKSYAP